MSVAKNKLYTSLPNDVKDILISSKGWLVGNSIQNLLDDAVPKDYDIIVLADEYITASPFITKYFDSFNTYGGFKLKVGNYTVDLWMESLEHFILSANKFTYAYNIRKNILISNVL